MMHFLYFHPPSIVPLYSQPSRRWRSVCSNTETHKERSESNLVQGKETYQGETKRPTHTVRAVKVMPGELQKEV